MEGHRRCLSIFVCLLSCRFPSVSSFSQSHTPLQTDQLFFTIAAG